MGSTVQPLCRLYVHVLVCKEPAQRCAGPGPTEVPQLMLLGRAFCRQKIMHAMLVSTVLADRSGGVKAVIAATP